MSNEKEGQVGYGHPPTETQFKPGQSGNPRGRPRGSLGFKSALRRAFEATGVSPTEFMMTALEAEIRKAREADEKARDRVLKWVEKHFLEDDPDM